MSREAWPPSTEARAAHEERLRERHEDELAGALERGDEWLSCMGCGMAYPITTTACGERCAYCDGELEVRPTFRERLGYAPPAPDHHRVCRPRVRLS